MAYRIGAERLLQKKSACLSAANEDETKRTINAPKWKGVPILNGQTPPRPLADLSLDQNRRRRRRRVHLAPQPVQIQVLRNLDANGQHRGQIRGPILGDNVLPAGAEDGNGLTGGQRVAGEEVGGV